MKKVIYKLNYTLVLVLGAVMLSQNISSQVTIGALIKPVDGALLDLKEKNPDSDNVTATKGLLLPRVHLSHRTSLWDIEGKPTNLLEHTGLTVYNTSTRQGFKPGVYYWDGEKWFSLMAEEEEGNPEDEDHTSYDPETGELKDHEGNRYETGDFGDAGIWTLQNIRTTSFPNKGGKIAHTDDVHENSDTEPQYGFPGKWTPEQEGNQGIPSFVREYGLLYNWAAATHEKEVPPLTAENEGGKQHDQIQGLCPNGWHLPTDAEWTQLENEFLKNTTKYSNVAANIGGTLPYDGAPNVRSTHAPAMMATMIINDGAKDVQVNGLSKTIKEKGFWVIPVGVAFTHTAEQFGIEAHFWTSSIYDSETGWIRKFSTLDPRVHNWFDSYPTMTSIRCKKDGTGTQPY